jgi:hypothetical protein
MSEFYYDISKTVDENATLISNHFKHLKGSQPINLALWMKDRSFYSITFSELETLEGTVV